MADPLPAQIPDDALVLLVGPSGAGKSTWAADHFASDAILSSDAFRAQVAGDAADQTANAQVFKSLHAVAAARLRRGLLTVIDATNLTVGARRALLRLADTAERPVAAVTFEVSLPRCLAQNAIRPDRRVPEDVVRRHHRQMGQASRDLQAEGYALIKVVRDEEMERG